MLPTLSSTLPFFILGSLIGAYRAELGVPWAVAISVLATVLPKILLKHRRVSFGIALISLGTGAFWASPRYDVPVPQTGMVAPSVLVHTDERIQWAATEPHRGPTVEAHVTTIDGRALGRARVSLPESSDPPSVGTRLEGPAWISSSRRGMQLRLSPRSTAPLGPRAWIGGLVRQIDVKIRRCLDDRLSPQAVALVLPLMLGDRLSSDFRDAARKAGALHFFAVSGLHLGILCWLFAHMPLLHRLPERLRVTWLFLLASFYGALTGGRPPVIRALCALGLGLAAGSLRRTTHPGWMFVVICAATLAIRRESARDVSFLLSFCAVAGMVFIGIPLLQHAHDDPLREFLARKTHPLRRWVIQGFILGYSVCVTTAPVSLSVFGTIAPVSILSNLILFPLVTAELAGGIAVLVTPWVAPIVEGVSFLVHAAIDILGLLPFSIIETTPPLKPLLVLHVFTLATTAMWLPRFDPVRRRLLGLLPLVTLSMILLWPGRVQDPSFHVLDVGQGSCALVHTGNRCIMIDAGSSSLPDGGSARILNYLRAQGIRSIDLLILSHADRDHVAAVDTLARRIPVRSVWLGSTHPYSDRALKHLQLTSTPIRVAHAGDEVRFGPILVSILAPMKGTPLHGNDASLVVMIQGAQSRILVPGDIEEPGTSAFLRGEVPDIDVLVIPHHGGRNSLIPALLAGLRPDTAIISARSGFPSSDTLDACLRFGVNVGETWAKGNFRIDI